MRTPLGDAHLDAPGWTPGSTVEGLYEIQAVLGEGGFGVVHQVRHLGWGMDLAVKSPRADRISSRRALEWFVQEANTWVGLGLHPNVVACYFVRIIRGLPRIFIERMEGGSLADWMRSGRIPDLKTALDLAIQAARAMEYAHSRGLVHRDLKPANCLMTPAGTLKVADFGLAKITAIEEAAEPRDSSPGARIARLREATRTGRLGTPAYMAPEQWHQAKSAAQAADAWSFGVMLHELLCKRRPFMMPDDEPPEVYCARMAEAGWPFEPLKDVPQDLGELAAQCLRVKAEERPASFAEILGRLERAYAESAAEAYPREPAKEAPLQADSLNNQGVSMADLNRLEEARGLFEQALRRDPTHPAAAYNLGLISIRSGAMRESELLARLEEIRKARPKDMIPVYLPGHAEFFAAPPCGAESARMEEAAFKALLSQAERESSAGRCGLAYRILLKARGVKGYEMDSAALDLQESLGRKGAHRGLKAGWQKRYFDDSASAACACFSLDGKSALSGHMDGTLKLWETPSGRPAWQSAAHSGPVAAAAFSSDGKLALSAGRDGILKFWDPARGVCGRTILAHAGGVSGLCALPGGRAFSAGGDGFLKVWSLQSGEMILSINRPESRVSALCAAPEGRALCAGRDGSLRLWDLDSGRLVRTFSGHDGPVNAVCAAPDGNCALSGGRDGALKLWAFSSEECVRTLRSGWPVSSVHFSPDGAFALSAGADRALRFWDLSSGECVRTLALSGDIRAACFCPDPRYALCAGQDGLCLWELDWEYDFPRADSDQGAKPPSRTARRWVLAAAAVLLLAAAAALVMRPSGVRESTQAPARTDSFSKADSATDSAAALRKARAPDLGEMILIPGGEFHMGPLNPFYMDKHETTAGEYGACVLARGCSKPDAGDRCNGGRPGFEKHPINCVDWERALAYCSWAGKRLPSEAEWEYAARSRAQERLYPWGEEAADCARAVMNEHGLGCGRGGTWPVCSKPLGDTAQGLCDMAGNVWEWTADRREGGRRSMRGGSFGSYAVSCRSGLRHGNFPDYASPDLGFRCARDPL
ncbi:MAG: SUMF1/EgtB/PvdO family nonheme iron enzyme [Elusimicrobia bacterium]|nr:SUMF1/EgtB/PvdO family nonheme iron enzyme [Elusimicrobiota bacterium]